MVEEPLPDGLEPLTLWEPSEGCGGRPVTVDNMLVRWLRPHQREGVQFMFECVAGLRLPDCKGCILADDMGESWQRHVRLDPSSVLFDSL